MASIVILELRVKDEAWPAFRENFPKILPDTRAFEGCLGLKGAVDDKERIILLYEEWRSFDDHARYMEWRGSRGDLAQLGAALREPPILRRLGELSI